MPHVPIHVVFWRHAEAGETSPEASDLSDLGRELTRQGRRDASRMAAWIKTHLPKPWTICASPAARTMQTAMALTDHPLRDPRLAPGRGVDDVLAVIDEHRDIGGTVVLVGHQPVLGSAALRWLGGFDAPFSLRKGALLWVAERQRDGAVERTLRAALAPDLVD